MNEKIMTKINWQHKIVEYIAYFSVILIPLYFGDNHLFTFNTPKILAMNALVLISTILYLWGNWDKKINIRFSVLGVVTSLFVLFLTLSSVFGIDPINSFFGWRNLMPLVSVYSLFVFALIVGSLIRNNKKIAIRLLLSSFIASIWVMIIFYSGIKEIDLKDGSTLGNSSYLGSYLIFNFFFGLGLFLYYKKLWQKILVALGSLFLVLNPLLVNKDFLLLKMNLSQVLHNPMSLLGIANGATMGVGLSVVFIAFLFMIFSKKRLVKIAGAILMVIFLSGIFFAGRELVTSGTSLNKVFTEEKSGNRFLVWDISKQEFLNNPILGNGYNNFIYSFDKYYNSQIYEKGYSVERFFKPHNVFWEFTSETGVLGLMGYLSLLLVLFFTLLNKKKNVEGEDDKAFMNVRIVLAGLLLGYFIQNLFVFDTISTYLMLFTIVAIGLGVSGGYHLKLGEKFDILKKIFIFIFIIFSAWMMYVLVIAPWGESLGTMKIVSKDKTIDISKTAQTRSGLSQMSIFSGVMDSTNLADVLFLIYQNALSKVNESNKKPFFIELDSIVSELEKDINKQPYYSESYLAISKILNLRLMIEMKEGKIVRFNGTNYNKDVWDKSYASIMKSLDLNPNNPQSYLVLSQLYMLKADFKNAYLYNKVAIDMAPEFKDTYDFGRFLLKVNPNKDFENYLNSMEKGIQPTQSQPAK